MKRAALYLRVSTDKQTTDNQRRELVEYAARREFEVVSVFDETVTGTGKKKRPQFEAMMAAGKRRAFDVVLVWAIDRFGRSTLGNVRDALALEAVGVELISLREPWTAGPEKSLFIAIFSWFAEQDARQISARTKAGLQRARDKGSRLGRIPTASPERVRELRAAGKSLNETAAALGCSKEAVRRAVRRGEKS